jgi:nitroreductase
METVKHSVLNSIFQRRAIRVFEPVEISPALRDELLEAARVARSRNGHDHRDRQEISSSH